MSYKIKLAIIVATFACGLNSASYAQGGEGLLGCLDACDEQQRNCEAACKDDACKGKCSTEDCVKACKKE